MDDIDRTFARLKRSDYGTLVSCMRSGPVVNPVTFAIEFGKWAEPTCQAHGWTLNELNKELKRKYEP